MTAQTEMENWKMPLLNLKTQGKFLTSRMDQVEDRIQNLKIGELNNSSK